MKSATKRLCVSLVVVCAFLCAAWQVSAQGRRGGAEKQWKSEDLSLLGIGMGVGDLNGDGRNEVVVIDPSTVYVFEVHDGKLKQVAEQSFSPLELKAVDVARLRKQGPARIYLTAQNRGALNSFVLELRNGSIVRVVENFAYYLRVIPYPSLGPILLGQRKGLSKTYEGPIYRLEDKGDELKVGERFGVPLKIPIFGFGVGDLAGDRKPLITVLDRDDHLRVYTPDGKRLFKSQDYYGGSDVILRSAGPEASRDREVLGEPTEIEYCRPRVLCVDADKDGAYETLVSSHKSKTMRMLQRTRMLEEGRVNALRWTGEVLEKIWQTPVVQGMVMDFAVDSFPGIAGTCLIMLERKKTDWLSFMSSKSCVRAYEIQFLLHRKPDSKERE
jgi:hypothetical protein